MADLKCAAAPECSDGWVVRAPAPTSPPCDLPSQSFGKQPQQQGHKGCQKGCGQRRQHQILASCRGAPRHRLAHPHLTRLTRPTRPPHSLSPTSPTSDSTHALPTASRPLTPPRTLVTHSNQHRLHRGHLARLARRGAAQHWSALVSAPGSRLARQMRPHLGTRSCGTSLWSMMRVGTTSQGELAAHFCARIGRAALCGHPRQRAVMHARGAGRSEGGNMGWGARGRQGSRAIATGPRAIAACDVPTLARDAARGRGGRGGRWCGRGLVGFARGVWGSRVLHMSDCMVERGDNQRKPYEQARSPRRKRVRVILRSGIGYRRMRNGIHFFEN